MKEIIKCEIEQKKVMETTTDNLTNVDNFEHFDF
jgi:hypothetical protein